MSHSHFLHKFLLIFWVFCLVGLGLRTLITGDSRWGWGMFKEQVNYQLDYFWVMENGDIQAYQTAKTLKGAAKKNLKDGSSRMSRYGLETVRLWIKAYVENPGKARSTIPNAIGFRAVFKYRINKQKPAQTETFEHYFIADK